jgi:hypothetical protein
VKQASGLSLRWVVCRPNRCVRHLGQGRHLPPRPVATRGGHRERLTPKRLAARPRFGGVVSRLALAELGDHRLGVEATTAGAFVPASGRLTCLPLGVTTQDERSFLRAGLRDPSAQDVRGDDAGKERPRQVLVEHVDTYPAITTVAAASSVTQNSVVMTPGRASVSPAKNSPRRPPRVRCCPARCSRSSGVRTSLISVSLFPWMCHATSGVVELGDHVFPR